MTKINSNHNVLSLGVKAAESWSKAESANGTGDAIAIKALYDAQRLCNFDAVVSRGKDTLDETVTFGIVDLQTPLYNADGSKDTKAMLARSTSLASTLFGITALTPAVKQRIRRAVETACYLIELHKDMSDDAYFNAVSLNGQNKLVVPHEAIVEAPAHDADDDAKTVFTAMQGKPRVLSGKDGLSVAKLQQRARPKVTGRAAGEAKDKGATFGASVKYINTIMAQVLNPASDESDVALSNELRRELYDLQMRLAGYFAIDPIAEDESVAA